LAGRLRIATLDSVQDRGDIAHHQRE
jgi:hypothetical protein